MAALAGSLGSSVPVVAACPVHWNQYLKQILAASGVSRWDHHGSPKTLGTSRDFGLEFM